MCGIAGIFNLDGSPVPPHELDRMTDSLAHRGPDGRGVYIDTRHGLGLGHRRLAILDPTPAGRQPMSYADGRYWITFNGEIYNFIELRRELTGLGHQFVTDTDTEVILAAYAQWGESCQLHFNGMWAFAIWDSHEGLLFLSRDRFGVKPMHYSFDGRRFAFASEMKAFLHLSGFVATYDPHAVASALSHSCSLEGTETCLLQGIKRLIGGHSLVIKPGRDPVVTRWWHTMDHVASQPSSSDRQIELLRELFTDACTVRMRSDVPLATTLSGGLDSSSVLCTIASLGANGGTRRPSDWQRAFVATFPGTVQDERHFAEQAIHKTGAIPCYKEIKTDEILDRLDDFLYQFEEIYDLPGAAWLIYRELRQNGVVVSLDGHGGDELLAGYHHHVEAAMLDAIWPKSDISRLRDLQTTLGNMYPPGVSFVMPSPADIPRWTENLKLLCPHAQFLELPPVGQPPKTNGASSNAPQPAFSWLKLAPPPLHFKGFRDDQPHLTGCDFLTRRLYYDFHYLTLPTILRNFDRVSMANGVEIRSPFMDWRVVCHAFSLPSSLKIQAGFSKYALRQAMSSLLPTGLKNRTSKIGFTNPAGDWVTGPLKEFVRDSVNSVSFLSSPIWNGPGIRDYAEWLVNQQKPAIGEAARVLQFIQTERLMAIFRGRNNLEVLGQLEASP